MRPCAPIATRSSSTSTHHRRGHICRRCRPRVCRDRDPSRRTPFARRCTWGASRPYRARGRCTDRSNPPRPCNRCPPSTSRASREGSWFRSCPASRLHFRQACWSSTGEAAAGWSRRAAERAAARPVASPSTAEEAGEEEAVAEQEAVGAAERQLPAKTTSHHRSGLARCMPPGPKAIRQSEKRVGSARTWRAA